MNTQSQIADDMQELIPTELWEKYSHLSFIEMAEIEELADYKDELIQAEKDWFDAE